MTVYATTPRKRRSLLAKSCDRIHFDEAWYGYARFNPMYDGHYAMRGDPATHKGATIFATHSTHKLLAALSQSSYIHIRDGRGAIDHQRFNQAYMMHTTTSPLYPIVASNDIASAMMDGRAGYSLTQEVIQRGRRLPADCRAHPQDVSGEERLVLQALERRERSRIRRPAARSTSRMPLPTCFAPSRTRG